MLCQHFTECGGCRFQDISYPEQLKNKETKIKETLKSFDLEPQFKPINFYPEWFYRGKMEFTFSKDCNQKIICGLYSKIKKHEIFDLKECLIFSKDLPPILETIKEFVNKRNYSTYNKYSHQGFLRHFIIREAKFTKQIMIGIVTTSEDNLDTDDLVKELLKLNLQSEIKSIYWIINNSWSDAVIFEKAQLLYGQPFIKEQLEPFTFNIGIDTFFQINSLGIKDLYQKIVNYAQLTTKERVLDLCCGTGTIGIFLSKSAHFVWGVDIQKEIIDLAFENAKLNNISNISFMALDIKQFLNSEGSFYKDIDLLVVNPPRSGLSPKVLRGINRLNPKRILYSSCNIESLSLNLKDLCFSGYKLEFIEPFDFFPHTPHVECLASIRK